MPSAFKSLLALAAVIFATMAYGAEADTCTYSEISDTDTVLSVYADAVNTNCATNTCASACLATLQELASYLPNCYYTDGVNYYATTEQAIASCDTTGTTTDDTTKTDGSACTNSQESDVETYIAKYGDAISAYCDTNVCASDCVTTLEAVVEYLPDCTYSDGTNYYETFVFTIESCSESTTKPTTSSDDSSTPAGGACSSSEVSDTDAYFAAISDEYKAVCTDNSCTSACLEVLNTLSKELPDCVYTDGTNYYQIVEQAIASCGSTTTPTTAPTTDTGSSSTADSGSSGSPSSHRTSIPAASTASPKTNANDATVTSGMSAVSAVAVLAVLVFV